MDSLKNKVIVVTGAASGIGKAVASEAARRGMHVLLADRNEPALAAAVSELKAQGATAVGRTVDVADAASVEALAEAAYQHFGAVHVLVNNAGIADAESAWDTSLELYDRMLGVNLYGVIHGVRAFVPRMLRARTQGHVINVASAAGLFTVPGFAAYSASKFAVVGLTEALFHDLATRGAAIGVSLVCPSWVRTQLTAVAQDPTTDAQTTRVRETIAQAVAHGIEPSSVATAMLEAVLEKRFYVLTHENSKAAVRARADDITLDRAPTSFLREGPAKPR